MATLPGGVWHPRLAGNTIALVGVPIGFVLGCILGGVSGYFGGVPC